MVVLVTGSSGLVGTAICKLLNATFDLRPFDVRRSPLEDIRRPVPLEDVEGIIHLAAVSRVVYGEQDPDLCAATNVTALHAILNAAATSTAKPWVIFASSREVYGDAPRLPAAEDSPYQPKNVYARSKVEGEQLCHVARDHGLTVNVARLSSVYGSTDDYADRVTPCFARAAAYGHHLDLEGASHEFDFTHVDDVAKGLVKLVAATAAKEHLPPVHFVSGHATTLGHLADAAAGLAQQPIDIRVRPPRAYGVQRFVGDPSRVERLLGWKAEIDIETGFANLVSRFRQRPEFDDDNPAAGLK